MLAIALDTYSSVSHDLGIPGRTVNRLTGVRDIPKYSPRILTRILLHHAEGD